MTSALQSLLFAAGAGSVATLALVALSTRLRPHDPGLWHRAWLTLALASIAAPAAALLPPLYGVVFIVQPANPASPTAGLTPERLALMANVIAAVALAGTAVLSWRLGIGLRVALQLATHAVPLSPAESARISLIAPGLAAFCRTHRRLRVPVAVGFRRGMILLPESWSRWPDDRLRAILRHEHTHLVRRDFAWNVIAAMHQALYWWNPLAWVVTRRIRFTAELASDRAAAGAEAALYTRHLLAAARDVSHSASPHRILAPGAVTDLAARVDALLTSHPHARPAGRVLARVLLGVVAAAVLLPMLVRARVTQDAPPFDDSPRHAVRHQAHGSH